MTNAQARQQAAQPRHRQRRRERQRRQRRRYARELTDAHWRRLKPLGGRDHRGPGRPVELDRRVVLNAIFYLVRTGCHWRYLPERYPPPSRGRYWFDKWTPAGTWERLNQRRCQWVRVKLTREPTPSGIIVDSQRVKTTAVGGDRGVDGHKQIKGRTRHVLTDTLGLLWKVVVDGATLPAAEGAEFLLLAVATLRPRLKQRWADGASEAVAEGMAPHFGIEVEITTPPEGQRGFVVLATRWIIERTIAWLNGSRRLSKDYERNPIYSESMIYIASIRYCSTSAIQIRVNRFRTTLDRKRLFRPKLLYSC
ncbi:MAG: IS5 family transposase [Ardenticatenaceae bacterium]|nr:IS5 family transposase [Ardenticatenaceae bacterium]